jgi:carboxyl-terminal processing protease
MVTLYEAITKISSNSLYAKTLNLNPDKLIKQYIYAIDEYGDYFTKEEYQAFLDSQSQDYAGIGMLLYQQQRNEKILCIPIDQKIDHFMHLKYDELLKVNGRPVKEKNIYLVTSWIRGKKGTPVTIEVKHPNGSIENLIFKRTSQSFKSVRKIKVTGNYPAIKILRFTNDTPREFYRQLIDWPKSIPIVIDLRGNGGGDLHAAIKSADLCLSKGTKIVTLETIDDRIVYVAANKDYTKQQRIVILQDKYTASAAEVFLSALIDNKRAESIGEKSYGKGVAQKFIDLSSGGALVLTYARIITPNGKKYHHTGLLPTLPISLEKYLKANQYDILFFASSQYHNKSK